MFKSVMRIMKKARTLVFGEQIKFVEPPDPHLSPKDEAFFNLKHIMRNNEGMGFNENKCKLTTINADMKNVPEEEYYDIRKN